MSKLQKYSTYNTLNNISPKSKKENILNKENSINNSNIKLKKKSIISSLTKKEEPKIEKTPKEILSLLLKNTLGKSLFKLEKSTKEQSMTLKEIGKYFIFFEKKLLSMKNGVEKKRKEEEKKQKMAAKKLKTFSTPNHTRSRTVQTLRKNRLNQDSNMTSISRTNIKNNPNIKTIFRKKTSGNLNLENTPKIRSRTVKPNRYNTNTNLNNIQRMKNQKEIINTPKRVKNEEQEKLSNTLQRRDSRRISRARIHKRDEENKGTERIGRKSIHKIIKKNNSSKKLIKTDEDKNKNNKNITTNINIINKKDINSSTKKEGNIISDFSSSNNKINNELKINPDESIKNINIDEILKDKKAEENKQNNIENILLKELEEYNEKKPKMEESKNNNNEIPRSRSKNKNKDDDIKDYKEMEGSLNNMQITLEGLNILKKERKVKFEKKKNNENGNKPVGDNNNINNNGNINTNVNINNNDIKSSIIQFIDDNDNNNKKSNFGKESQIMNEEIINTIENDKNILNNSIFDNNLFILNKNIEKDEFFDNTKEKKEKENKENTIKSINEEIILIEKDRDKNKDKENNLNNNINNNINDNINDNNNNIKEKEKEKEDREQKINSEIKIEENAKSNVEEKKEIIQSELGIMHDEQLVDPNQSSLINQSSIMNQSAILAEQYVLISRNEDEPFSIENIIKFEKSQILTILDFLDFKEKIQFTGINRGFNIERIYILNDKREELIRSLDLSSDETIDDLIMKIRLKYSNDELNKKYNEFQVSRGAVKAVELLNNPLYSKLFKKPVLEKNSEEICKIYRILFTLLGEYKIANIPEDDYFWIKCTEYLNNKSNGKIGSFILDKFKNITFDKQKIVLMNKYLIGMKKKINPNYFPKICGTTGLLIFLIKDALEYCGVIINDKKTQPSRILDNLMYYKNTTETLAQIIEYLSGVRTYKIREKKEN